MSATVDWVKFFSAAGIPPKFAVKYAAIFQDHRIQKDMLKDLNKEILYDMGIKTMGDVIAIMRQAREVDDEETRAKVLGSQETSVVSKTAVRIVRTAKLTQQTMKPTGISTSLAKRLSGSQSNSGLTGILKKSVQEGQSDVKKRLSLPVSGTTLSMSGTTPSLTGTTPSDPSRVVRLSTSSVFDRLGGSSTTVMSGNALRKVGGGDIAFASIKQTATVKPLKTSTSLSTRFTPYSVKDRLGGIKPEEQVTQHHESALFNLISSNIRSKTGTAPPPPPSNPSNPSNPRIIPLKKSIFDRLGS